MKPLVIYHDNCTDGFGAAFAAWMKFGEDAEYLPMSYGALTGEMNDKVRDAEVYVLDFSFSKLQMNYLFRYAANIVWLDHHKTAFEMWCPAHGYDLFTQGEIVTDSKPIGCHIVLDNNKSGALLAWEFFHPDADVPQFIRNIDDRDRWQFKLEGSKEVHAFLQSIKPWTFEKWERLLSMPEPEWNGAVLAGEGILRVQEQNVQQMAKQARKCCIWKHCGDVLDERNEFEENGLAANACLHQSELGHELANMSGTYGLIWYFNAAGRINCSLRSNGAYDVSAIAKAFGGGGHKNAAGFETDAATLLGWLT
jgi:uncharacterized protein